MDETSGKLRVEFIYLPVIGFAMQQNGISVVRRLLIENRTVGMLKDIKIILTTTPVFGSADPLLIETIGGGGTVCFESLPLDLPASYFTRLTEKLEGCFTLEIFSGPESIFRQTYPITILAFDQWGGTTVLPEILSAFITPNYPATASIIKRAATILEKWTGNPSLDEYQSRNLDRVRKQIAAIYTAISEQNIICNTASTSFESYGQRIHLADSVMLQKLGTSLDLALLYASCLESVGIHALVVLTSRQVFAGAWLIPETFPDSIIDDVSFLTKRTADGINDITLVDISCAGLSDGADFDHAVKIANSRLLPSSDYILTIDVKRTRLSGIKPVPQRVQSGKSWVLKEEEATTGNKIQAAPENISPYNLSGISSSVVITKQLLWERKLLDLSLRNNLLNVRITKNTLQLIPSNLARFEDALAGGDEFHILQKPDGWENPSYNFGLYQAVAKLDPVMSLIGAELEQKRLRSYLSENELNNALTFLYRSSRTAMEENGANTLYIALGLLRWYETPSSERPRYAPILLLPVEIVRKSSARGYIIRSREEDTMMNITLLEMLRQNFGITVSGLDPLPVDDSGVNVKLIYTLIRNSIKNQRKWDVEEQAILGIFSFNKFIMWNDIHNNSHKLIKNEVVSSLMNGVVEWNADAEMVDATVLDKQVSPAEIVLPISADSSQLEAIYEAVQGRTFVLHGPPGTGKSQTITNIIANALYRGKRVLFVAEKMAALSVVQNRLLAIGIDPFCLELHSNKMNKSAILSQLKEASEVVKQTSPEEFEKEALRLLALRTELNVYIEALHNVYPFGISLYDAITRYQLLNTEPEFILPQSCLHESDGETAGKWDEALDLLVSVANACGHPYNHPLSGINIAGYSLAVKDEVLKTLTTIIELLIKIKAELPVFSGLVGESEPCHTRKDIDKLSGIIEKLLYIPELTPALLTSPRLNEVLDEYREVIIHGRKHDLLQAMLETEFTSGMLAVDASQLLVAWNQSAGMWFLPRYFSRQKIKKQLRFHASHTIATNDVKDILTRIISYKQEAEYLSRYAGRLSSLFGQFGKAGKENWDVIEQIIEDTSTINSLILSYTKDVTIASKMKERLARHLTEGVGVFKSIHEGSLFEINTLLAALTSSELYLLEIADVSQEVLYTGSGNWIDSALSKLTQWKANIDKLKDWYQWLLVCRRMTELKIGFVATEYKDKNMETTLVKDTFKKSFYKAAIQYILVKEPELELFNGKIFNDKIEKYKQLAAKFERVTRQELYARLASGLPVFTREATQNSEVGILQKNIRNNARGISIRKLFDQIPNLLSRMCPCMLMSPISVAQYIDADADRFDLVIFDEASQMPTYEAVGAIARGKSVVIVGDPKQMPPTNFFSSSSVDEENIELEDLESILDDCLALSMPSKYLLWHYRSRHESLIAFSNSEYYGNKLLTFPSPNNIESKVNLVRVTGFYDKGKSRQNKAEAQAVINEIERRLRDETLRKKSIGVVTFSSVQQLLIEDLLSELFTIHPELETLALNCEEPLFIKNLENVQGDERDIILFSVGYGPDAEGRVSMNFGPLNRAGGERRLNVAVSRARYEMIIYSTLHPDQINLNRTSSVGVAGLKRFLEYAEKGERVAIYPSPSVSSASIADVIAGRLRTMGYEVHTNIGCSGYKIDLGIVDAKNPSTYRLGILCDGENYKCTKTARDREIVQNSVLKSLGWNLFCIWTIDWWENPDNVILSLQEVMESSERKENSIPVKKDGTEAADMLLNPATVVVPLDIKGMQHGEQKYQASVLCPVDIASDAFYLSENRTRILSQLTTVLQTEAPISRSLLCKKVLISWGISRLGTRLDTYFETLFEQLPYYRTEHDGITFCWNSEVQFNSYTLYRTGSGRDAVDLPPEEVANGIKHIVTNEISLPTADLSRSCAQLFGFARSGSNVEAAIQRGLKEALRKGYITMDNERVVIN